MLRLTGNGGGMSPAQVDALLRAAIAPVQEMAQAAKNQALGAEARAEAAETEAANAVTLGQQAHNAIATTEAKADGAAAKADAIDVKRSEYEAALAASVADRAAIRAAITALTARVATLEAAKVQVAYGNANVTGSLLAGATTNLTVTLSRNMGTGYSIGYGLAGGTSLLGSLVIAGVAAQTATTVTLTIRNAGLTALANLTGAVVHVVAAKEG